MATEVGRNVLAKIKRASEKLKQDGVGVDAKQLAATLWFSVEIAEILAEVDAAGDSIDADDHALLDPVVPGLRKNAELRVRIAQKIGVTIGGLKREEQPDV